MYTLFTLWISLKHLEFCVSFLTHTHKTCHVSASVAVVWSWPHCHQILSLEPSLVSWLNQLMRPNYQFQPVILVKFRSRPTSKKPTNSSTSQHPSINLIRIWPNKVSKTSWSRYLANSINIHNIIDCSDIGW